MGSHGLDSSELCSTDEVEGEQTTAEETECSTGTSGQEIIGASRSVGSCAVMGELGWRSMTERSEEQMMRYLVRGELMNQD